ncbi:MAG: hypothetical protein HY066_14790 [Betaproteobacteria bacterium]|nr:hypothetical protein [Betaproteobacteria bacterium]
MEMQEAYKQKLSAQLKEWDAQINLFAAKAESAGADMKIRHAETLRELRGIQHTASERMRDLEKASGEAWEQVRLTADKVWEDLKTGMADAHSRFK